MSTEFIAENLWSRITSLAKKKRGDVAVAYCAAGARKLLPLKRGSCLVVDASEHAVRSGQTDPRELLYFLKRGVSVHSVGNLHAKVFVFGRVAVLGSMNVSRRSAGYLREAAVVSTDRAVVGSARGFIQASRGEEISVEHATRLKKLYKPPRWVAGGPKRLLKARRKKPVLTHSPLWVVPLFITTWDARTKAEARKARPAAQARIRTDKETLDEFDFDGAFCGRLKVGHLLVQTVEDGRARYVLPAGHVVGIRRFRGARGGARMVVFVALPRHSRRKSLKAVRVALGRHARFLPRGYAARLIRDPVAAHELLSLWMK